MTIIQTAVFDASIEDDINFKALIFQPRHPGNEPMTTFNDESLLKCLYVIKMS